ncbi:carboxypeptidase-like regulatory domain-containing protein [Tenacibaculum sp. 190524A02b]|uniref:TonB-dependent receptor n=1 Tax=Tenacibaculum vairaonense TaxID=3137860 RepID=UPI0031FA688D
MRKWFVLLSCLCSVFCLAQNPKPLKDFLIQLEEDYNIKFSFSDENINSKFILVPKTYNPSLNEALLQINKQTKLIVKRKSKRYYVLTKKNKETFQILGKIIDSISGLPLNNASILYKKNKGVVSNNKGKFVLQKISKTDTITISHLGYHSKNITLKKENSLESLVIKLVEKPDYLNEVIIPNFLTSGMLKKIDGTIELLPQKQGVLPGLTEPDVLLSTQQIPGINSPTETASGLYIHGSTPDQNLILFDNIKLYNTAHFFGVISALNPYIIDKVLVMKNATQAQYGNHIGGVVSIKTLEKIPNKSSFGFGFNLTGFDFHSNLKLSPKIAIQASARRSLSDILETPTIKRFSKKVFQNTAVSSGEELAKLPFIESINNFHFFDISTKIIYKPNHDSKLSLQYITIKNQLDYQLKNEQLIEQRNDGLEIQNNGVGLSFNTNFNPTTQLSTNLYYSDYNLDYKGIKKRETDIYDFTEKENKLTEVSFYTYLLKKFKKHRFKLGYEYTNHQVSFNLKKENNVVFSEILSKDDRLENVNVFVGNYRFQNDDIFTLNVGARYSYLTKLQKEVFEPRIFTKVKVFPFLWWHGSAELKQQHTSKIIEFFTSDFGLENELWALSDNDNIPILNSQKYSSGFLLKKSNWFLDIELYHKKIDGLTSLTTGFNNYNRSIFNGNAIINGFDVLLKKNWSSKLSSWVSYSFNNSSLLFENFNNNQSFSGNFNISNSLYIAQQFKLNRWNFSLGWNYRSGLPFNSLVNLNPNNGIEIERYNNANLPAYHRLDSSVTFDFYWNNNKNIKSMLGISFQNLYNRKNILRRTKEVSFDKDFNASLQTIETYGLDFTPNFVFRVKF